MGRGAQRDDPGHKPIRRFKLSEVSQHDRPDDCWVIIRGKVYDVTTWVPHHPGGAMIYVKAGGDCTQLFDSYHRLSARKVLQKYYIGEVSSVAGLTHYDDEENEEFYTALKIRVEKYFRDHKGMDSRMTADASVRLEEVKRNNGTKRRVQKAGLSVSHVVCGADQIHPRVSIEMYVKSALILTTLFMSYYLAFFYIRNGWGATLCAAYMGVMFAEVGVSIQHDANHGAYSTVPWLGHLMGLTLDLVGASSFMWKKQHVVGHHNYTNVNDMDPDIRVNDPDVRRVTPQQPHRPYHRWQHLYLGVMYGVLALKSVLADDFQALSSGQIGSVDIGHMAHHETLSFWGFKLLYAVVFLGLPIVAGCHHPAAAVGLWLLAELITGWILAFLFQVAHVVPDVEYLSRGLDGRLRMGWAESQMRTSADFSHGSWFWTHFSGGLNYQVVHHLFPGVCHCHYPKLAPIVQETAAQYGIPYHVYPSFWVAIKAHFQHLKNVGHLITLPSLATVG